MNAAGPVHSITIEPNPRRVRVTYHGKVIADSTHALSLREASYPAVQYIPRADVDMTLLRRTAHTTHCPHKGDASYYSIDANGQTATNAVWTYEEPYYAAGQIRDHVAFYPDRVDAIEVIDA